MLNICRFDNRTLEHPGLPTPPPTEDLPAPFEFDQSLALLQLDLEAVWNLQRLHVFVHGRASGWSLELKTGNFQFLHSHLLSSFIRAAPAKQLYVRPLPRVMWQPSSTHPFSERWATFCSCIWSLHEVSAEATSWSGQTQLQNATSPYEKGWVALQSALGSLKKQLPLKLLPRATWILRVGSSITTLPQPSTPDICPLRVPTEFSCIIICWYFEISMFCGKWSFSEHVFVTRETSWLVSLIYANINIFLSRFVSTVPLGRLGKLLLLW